MPLDTTPQDAPPSVIIQPNVDYVPQYQVQPAHWVYDLDPTTGTSRAGYSGIVNLPAGTVIPAGMWASPGAIGVTTPNSGAFTTLSATSTVSGAGFTNWAASPPPIGSTTANTGRFTNLTATGTLATTGAYTPNSTAGIVGTTTNDNANAGAIGEVITSTVVSTTVSLTTAVPVNIASISLTAGDWDIQGSVTFRPAGTTAPTSFTLGLSGVSAALPSLDGGQLAQINATFVTGANAVFPIGPVRWSLASTTTIYLVAMASFTVSTMTAGGTISARRRR